MTERKTTQQEVEIKDFGLVNIAIGGIIVVSVILLVIYIL